MFLKSKGGYRKDGEQWAKGPFLILFSLSCLKHKAEALRELRACVRTVSFHQLGNFMMGHAIIGPHRIPLSGAYGGDGLPRTPDAFPGLWERLIPLPVELADQFWSGGGHNSAGPEWHDIHAWALANEKQLRIRWAVESDQIFMPSFCNHGHDLATGKPINHECFVLNPAALQAEREGDYKKAVELLSGKRIPHPGIKRKELK